MTNQISDKEACFKILEEILQSADFSHNEKYQELLRFLVEANVEGRSVNEKQLAIEFFGKDESFDPAIDSSVRAYMSNLRKKLEHYNLTKGKDNSIVLKLPKGGYHAEFVYLSNKSSRFLKLLQKPHLFYLVIIAILLISLIALGIEYSRHSSPDFIISKNNRIWADFFKQERKTLIVLGDYYFFKMLIDTQTTIYARDIFINSDTDLTDFLNTNPGLNRKISRIYHTYLDEHIPLCLSHILPGFTINGIQPQFKLSSEVRLEDLQDYNIIFIGSYKTLYLLETVTRNLNFNYELKPGESLLKYVNQDSNKVFTYSFLTNPDTQARNDYALVVKVSGHNQNTFLFFLSQHDFGILATVKYFTNPDYLREFQQSISSEYFEALFEVTGIIRTDFDIKLIHVNELFSTFEIKLEN